MKIPPFLSAKHSPDAPQFDKAAGYFIPVAEMENPRAGVQSVVARGESILRLMADVQHRADAAISQVAAVDMGVGLQDDSGAMVGSKAATTQ